MLPIRPGITSSLDAIRLEIIRNLPLRILSLHLGRWLPCHSYLFYHPPPLYVRHRESDFHRFFGGDPVAWGVIRTLEVSRRRVAVKFFVFEIWSRTINRQVIFVLLYHCFVLDRSSARDSWAKLYFIRVTFCFLEVDSFHVPSRVSSRLVWSSRTKTFHPNLFGKYQLNFIWVLDLFQLIPFVFHHF